MSFRRPEYYFYEHVENKLDVVDLSVIDKASDKLVVSYSTITTAIHLAAYMGARNIILVGHDCGLIDGKATFDGYYRDMSVSPWSNAADYEKWLGEIEDQTLIVKRRIKGEFGCNIVSVNPFVNFGLEGHKYTRTRQEFAIQPAMSAEAKKPALLLCNGPSFAKMRVPLDLQRFVICRVNFFFLEDEPFADGRVDHMFWSVNEPALHDGLLEVVQSQRYRIRQFNCPVHPSLMQYSNGQVLERPFFGADQLNDHWTLIAKHPTLARAQMMRPLPTSGLQALAYLAALGHEEIYIAGMDFYADAGTRYGFTIPASIQAKLDPKHFTPGYEKNAHTLAADVEYLRLILQEFPSLKLYLLSDMPVLRKYAKERVVDLSLSTEAMV